MKKLVFIAIVGLLVMPALPSMAAVENTAHDMSLSYGAAEVAGICSPCHLPHGQTGARLFPDTGADLPLVGIVGQLCKRCHYAGLGITNLITTSDSELFAFGGDGHGAHLDPTLHPDLDATVLEAGGLPYVSAPADGDLLTKTMECTSCHDVHNDNSPARPFLRTDINVLCGRCHANRHFIGGSDEGAAATGAGNWTAAEMGLGNNGSHPVGLDVTGEGSNLSPTIGAITTLITPFNTAALANPVGGWEMGGHLTGGATGGVNCVTCHAVHGIHDDAGMSGTEPTINMLVIAQADAGVDYNATGGLTGHSTASGYNGHNAFCEACHSKDVNTTGYGANLTAITGGIPGQKNAVDPGTTGYTHPLDGIEPSQDWLDDFATATGWPTGSTAVYSNITGPAVICESCHVAHPAANLTATTLRADINTGAAAYILRDDPAQICNNCHNLAGSNNSAHHPVGMTYDNSGLTNALGADGGVLGCGTCHGGGARGAHNWTSTVDVGMHPNWLPSDNGRDYADPAADALNDDMSEMCMQCHFTFQATDDYNPTMEGTGAIDPADPAQGNETEYNYLGLGTHFLGDTITDPTADLNPITPLIYTAGTAWTAAGNNGGWSRFRTGMTGQTGVGIVCESCHELEPDKNNSQDGTVAFGHLLLANFREGGNGDEIDPGGTADGRDDFCEACHMPVGTHPLSRDVVGRSGEELATIPDATRTWIVATPGAPTTWNAGATGVGDLSCDSCHQVHDANTASGNMILEATVTTIPDVVVPPPSSTNPVTFVPTWPDNNKGPNHEDFCQLCHSY